MMLKKMYEINDYLDTNNGIIKTIQTKNVFTWLSSDDADVLDLEYYINHSYDKYISLLTNKLYEDNETTYLSKLADVIILRFKDKWNKLWNAVVSSDYNPIENYSMIEDENVASKITSSSDNSNNIFGFNTTSDDGIEQNKGSISGTTEGLFDDNHRQLTRSGNIGVTTSQQMIESEIELRKWNFYQSMMNDIDAVMCLAYRGV